MTARPPTSSLSGPHPVARGKTSADIARKLRLSKRTVDFHLDNPRIKLRAGTPAEATIKAAASGLIKP